MDCLFFAKHRTSAGNYILILFSHDSWIQRFEKNPLYIILWILLCTPLSYIICWPTHSPLLEIALQLAWLTVNNKILRAYIIIRGSERINLITLFWCAAGLSSERGSNYHTRGACGTLSLAYGYNIHTLRFTDHRAHNI